MLNVEALVKNVSRRNALAIAGTLVASLPVVGGISLESVEGLIADFEQDDSTLKELSRFYLMMFRELPGATGADEFIGVKYDSVIDMAPLIEHPSDWKNDSKLDGQNMMLLTLHDDCRLLNFVRPELHSSLRSLPSGSLVPRERYREIAECAVMALRTGITIRETKKIAQSTEHSA